MSQHRARPAGRPRTGARVAAVQALFQSEQTGESAETVAQQFIRHRIGAGEGSEAGEEAFEEGRVPLAHVPLFEAILVAAAARSEQTDAEIRGHLAKEWTLERLDPVLRALLRAAAAELLAPKEPPARVVINEYLDIARGFLDEETCRFANGVLDAMAHALRPAEFGEAR